MSRDSGPLLTAATASAACIAVLAAVVCGAVWAEPVIGVDPSGIRSLPAKPPLTKAEQDAVFAKMMATIKANLDEAFGQCNTVVQEWPPPKPPEGGEGLAGVMDEPPPTPPKPDRTVTTHPPNPSRTTGPPANEWYHPWGESHVSDPDVDVFAGKPVKEYPSSFKNPDGSWNTDKLGAALGNIAAHEIAHTYSCPHAKGGTSKMEPSHGPNALSGDLHLGPKAKKILQANRGTPPCAQAIANGHLRDGLEAPFYCLPGFTPGEDPIEVNWTDAGCGFGGPAASFFDIGWWGADTDDGAEDGNEWADFVFKGTMNGTETDLEMLTFFEGLTTHFVLRGVEGGPYQGQKFDLQPEWITLSDMVVRPDGLVVGRQADLRWDIDGDGVPDVEVHLDTQVYGPESPEFAGFVVRPASPLNVAQAKLKIDGNCITLHDAAVTASFPGRFYVESAAGMGLAVQWSGLAPPENAVVRVEGKTRTMPNGERALEGWTVLPVGFREVGPAGMSNRMVGGGDFKYKECKWPRGQQGVEGGRGINTIGKLVRTWGAFRSLGPNLFVLDDGSGRPIMRMTPPEVIVPPVWSHAVATGICSCEKTETGLTPLLMLRRQSDFYGLML